MSYLLQVYKYRVTETILETVTLKFSFSVMAGVMVFKYGEKLDMDIGFNAYFSEIGYYQCTVKFGVKCRPYQGG